MPPDEKTEPNKQRKPGNWVVLRRVADVGAAADRWEFDRVVGALSAKSAISAVEPEPGVQMVAIPERNWRPYTAEVPPTPQAILRPVRSDG